MTEVDTTPTETDTATLELVTAAARRAAPQLAGSTTADRARWLEAVADALDAATDELVAIANEETSLGTARLSGEVARTTGQLRLFGSVITDGAYLEATIDHGDPEAQPPRPDLRRMLVPLGPVAVFTASNFPFAFSVAGGDTASALAAGCPVIVKAHPGHPRLSDRTSVIVADALADAGAPDGTFAMVAGYEAGRQLVLDPAVKAAGFTGSLSGGRALFDLANSRADPIPFYGELASLNPVLITPAADGARSRELAAGLVDSFTLGAGQFCTKPGLVLVPAGGELESAVVAAMEGPPDAAMLNERIAASFAGSLRQLIETGRVEVLVGDPDRAVTDGVASTVVLTTDTDRLTAEHDVLLEECFGPVTLLVRYDGESDLDRVLALLPGSLTVTIHAEDDDFEALAPRIEQLRDTAGRVIFGGWPTGVAVNWAQQHGGPWPSTTSSLHTSVGASAIRRFLRPVAFQDAPETLLPPALRDANPLAIPRRVDGALTLG
jgi:NADP-dependent aldehyde dehydrogenase